MSGAVFLSYAREDTGAAQRMAEALRSHGVQVWFDQGELRGGDAWDSKIRKQIKDCALFMPVISANTQARMEGYFRLEWRLADQRTHLMGRSKTFLVPVCVDGTRDGEADVPDSFLAAQWTRLPGGETSPAFSARINQLLADQSAPSALPSAASGQDARPIRGRRGGKFRAILAVAGAAVIALWFELARRHAPQGDSPPVPATATAGGRDDEASSLVKQARDMIYDPDSAHSEFALADSLLKRATEIDPKSADAWAASALCNYMLYWRAYDLDRKRLVQSEADGEKALRLNARAVDALLALGLDRQIANQPQAAQGFLDKAHAIDPQNPRVLIALAFQIEDMIRRAQFLEKNAGQVARPAELYYYAGFDFEFANRIDEGAAVFDRSIAAGPFWRTYVARAGAEYWLSADPAKVDAWLDHVPELKREEPRVAFLRFKAAMLRRNGSGAERLLTAVANDYFEDNFYVGPKSYLLAQAMQLAGHAEDAREQWQLAERALRDKLTAEPDDFHFRAMLAVAVIAQDRPVDGKVIADACAKDDRLDSRLYRSPGAGFDARNGHMTRIELAHAYALLGDAESAVAMLKANLSNRAVFGYQTAPTLRAEPRWDPLRGDPRFEALLNDPRNNKPLF